MVKEALSDRFNRDFRRDGISDEAAAVRLLVQMSNVFRRRLSSAAEFNFRAQDDARNSHPALLVLLEISHRMVALPVDDEALLRRDRQEREHMTARQCRDQGFLGIHEHGITTEGRGG